MMRRERGLRERRRGEERRGNRDHPEASDRGAPVKMRRQKQFVERNIKCEIKGSSEGVLLGVKWDHIFLPQLSAKAAHRAAGTWLSWGGRFFFFFFCETGITGMP